MHKVHHMTAACWLKAFMLPAGSKELADCEVEIICQGPKSYTEDKDTSLVNYTLASSLVAFYEAGAYTDAQIVVEGQTLHVHRLALSAASPVLDKLFSSGMIEGVSC